jgi:catechol 2,3-dioxygenase-like lactoylglutathione lyase family enzyme
MLTRIDHIMVCVADLAAGMAQYRKLGFDIEAGGVHPGKGTHNAIAFNREDYIELIAIGDRSQYDRVAGASLSHDGGLAGFVAAGGGIRYVAIQCDDLEAQVQGMRARGVEVSDPITGSRTTPSGLALHWRVAVLGAANPLPIFFIEHLTPLDQRRSQVARAGQHPNGVQTIERVYIVTPELDRGAAMYARVLGMAQPTPHKGTVIMADMAVFDIGPSGLCIAQPYAQGPAAAALARRGPGVFQALCRTTSMAHAARWMASQGMPSLPRGVRSNGERAMLAAPDVAGGTYLGFVGPE